MTDAARPERIMEAMHLPLPAVTPTTIIRQALQGGPPTLATSTSAATGAQQAPSAAAAREGRGAPTSDGAQPHLSRGPSLNMQHFASGQGFSGAAAAAGPPPGARRGAALLGESAATQRFARVAAPEEGALGLRTSLVSGGAPLQPSLLALFRPLGQFFTARLLCRCASRGVAFVQGIEARRPRRRSSAAQSRSLRAPRRPARRRSGTHCSRGAAGTAGAARPATAPRPCKASLWCVPFCLLAWVDAQLSRVSKCVLWQKARASRWQWRVPCTQDLLEATRKTFAAGMGEWDLQALDWGNPEFKQRLLQVGRANWAAGEGGRPGSCGSTGRPCPRTPQTSASTRVVLASRAPSAPRRSSRTTACSRRTCCACTACCTSTRWAFAPPCSSPPSARATASSCSRPSSRRTRSCGTRRSG